MLKYVLQEMNDVKADGKTRSYYKVPTYSNIAAEQLLNYMKENKGMTNSGIAESVLSNLMASVSDMLLLGHTVTVPHLGTFRLSIGPVKGRTVSDIDGEGKQLNAHSITVRGVRFKPSKEFMDRLREDLRLEGDGLVQRVNQLETTRDDRLQMLKQALATSPSMNVVGYMELTGLRRSMATKELAAFAADPASGIKTKGAGSHKVYVLG